MRRNLPLPFASSSGTLLGNAAQAAEGSCSNCAIHDRVVVVSFKSEPNEVTDKPVYKD
jgi:hypothetical protein